MININISCILIGLTLELRGEKKESASTMRLLSRYRDRPLTFNVLLLPLLKIPVKYTASVICDNKQFKIISTFV